MAEDIERQPRQGYSGPPATLGSTLAANARVIVMCRHCGHEAEPDLKHQILRYGAELPLPEWGARLVCSQCASHHTDFVVTGARR